MKNKAKLYILVFIFLVALIGLLNYFLESNSNINQLKIKDNRFKATNLKLSKIETEVSIKVFKPIKNSSLVETNQNQTKINPKDNNGILKQDSSKKEQDLIIDKSEEIEPNLLFRRGKYEDYIDAYF